MTTRKPAGVSFQSFDEQQIADARRRGAFDSLPGRGKPIAGLSSPHDPDWWGKQLVAREQLNLLPDTLQLRLDVERGVEKILQLPTESAVRRHAAQLNISICKGKKAARSGPAVSIPLVDVDALVAQWRDQQRG